MTKSYTYHNHILCIPASLLYDDWGLMSYDSYKKKCVRRHLFKVKDGRGEGNEALVSYHDLPPEYQATCKERLGKPEEVVVVNLLEDYIVPCKNVANFFATHRTPSGRGLSPEKQRERATACFILNAIQTVLGNAGITKKIFGRKSTKIWANISDAVNKLDLDKWHHCLPSSDRRLRPKYEEYLKDGAQIFIHKGEGNELAIKIKGEVGDYILAKYALPNKMTIPEVLADYNQVKEARGYPDLTREAIYNWLYKPEQERRWTLGRHGKPAYDKKYQHKLTRDKSQWFPNVYWGIDGTKLDWVHVEETSSNKMGAKLRIDVLFDIYSEKILGYSLSESESHLDHFVAIKMAVQKAGCRPYLYTYDNQSGHKTARMQELYHNLVAVDGGVHYPHKARQHGSPVEQLFNRLQQQEINKMWYSDGQSITVRRDDNKANWDFISENKHLLKTKEELRQDWEAMVARWNNAEHPNLGISRNEVYAQPMPQREDLNLIDIMQYLWLNETKPITYRREGISTQVGEDSYAYEVYTADGHIDIEFRRKNVGKKFIVRYDPDNMDTFIQLMEQQADGSLAFVANAEPKRKHVDIPVLMGEGDKARFYQDYDVRKQEYERDKADLEDLYRRTGISPRRLIAEQDLMVKMKGVSPKQDAIRADTIEDDIANRM